MRTCAYGWFETFRLKLMIRKMGIESHFWAPRKEMQKNEKKQTMKKQRKTHCSSNGNNDEIPVCIIASLYRGRSDNTHTQPTNRCQRALDSHFFLRFAFKSYVFLLQASQIILLLQVTSFVLFLCVAAE